MRTLLSSFRTSHHIISLSLADLTDDIARRRTRRNEGPSITWTVGHLLDARHKVLAYLGESAPSPWAASFRDASATDGADYPGIDAMRAEWERMHIALESAFAESASDALDEPVGRTGIHGESTVHDRVAFLAWHEAYHAGVIGAVRTAAGLPGPAVLAREAAAARS
jgi:uncharacterized damage-inducible protein DinB